MSFDLRMLMKMKFHERFAELRKKQGMTQQALADAIGIHVSQVKRYEAGTSQPTLEVLRKIALALHISADLLLFDENERGPHNDLQLQFEAVDRLSKEDKNVISALLDAFVKKQQIESIIQRGS